MSIHSSHFSSWMQSVSATRVAFVALLLGVAFSLTPVQRAYANHVRFPEGTASPRMEAHVVRNVGRDSYSPPGLVLPRLTRPQYLALFTRLANQGYRVTSLHGYVDAATVYYDSTWVHDPASQWESYVHMTGAQFQARSDEFSAEGYQLMDVSAYMYKGMPYFIAVWMRESPASNRHTVVAQRHDS